MIALARAGRIRAHVERFPLTEGSMVYDELRAGHVRGRAMVVPTAA